MKCARFSPTDSEGRSNNSVNNIKICSKMYPFCCTSFKIKIVYQVILGVSIDKSPMHTTSDHFIMETYWLFQKLQINLFCSITLHSIHKQQKNCDSATEYILTHSLFVTMATFICKNIITTEQSSNYKCISCLFLCLNLSHLLKTCKRVFNHLTR